MAKQLKDYTREELLKVSPFDTTIPRDVQQAAMKARQEVCNHHFGGPMKVKHCWKCGKIEGE